MGKILQLMLHQKGWADGKKAMKTTRHHQPLEKWKRRHQWGLWQNLTAERRKDKAGWCLPSLCEALQSIAGPQKKTNDAKTAKNINSEKWKCWWQGWVEMETLDCADGNVKQNGCSRKEFSNFWKIWTCLSCSMTLGVHPWAFIPRKKRTFAVRAAQEREQQCYL